MALSNYLRGCRMCEQASSHKFLFRENETWDILKCPQCGFITTDPVPTLEELEKFYSEKYLSGKDSHVDLLQRVRQKPFKQVKELLMQQHITKEEPILDVGCAYGAFLQYMKEQRFTNLTGVDLSRQAIKYIAENLKLNARQGTLQQSSFADGQFAAVTMNDTFEHLPDFVETLREVRRILRPEGLFFVRLPNMNFHIIKLHLLKLSKFKWTYGVFTPPGHLNHFHPQVLACLFQHEGLEVVKATNGIPALYGSKVRVIGLQCIWAFSSVVRGLSFGYLLYGNSLVMMGKKH